MEYIFCIIGLVGLIILCVMIGISQFMAKMPPKSNEKIGGMPFGASFKNDCNDDNSWTG